MGFLSDGQLVKQLKQDKAHNLQFLQEQYAIGPPQIDALYHFAKFQFDCGNYSLAAEFLYHYRYWFCACRMCWTSFWVFTRDCEKLPVPVLTSRTWLEFRTGECRHLLWLSCLAGPFRAFTRDCGNLSSLPDVLDVVRFFPPGSANEATWFSRRSSHLLLCAARPAQTLKLQEIAHV